MVLNIGNVLQWIRFYYLELILNGTLKQFIGCSQLLITETNCMNIVLFYYHSHILLLVLLLLW